MTLRKIASLSIGLSFIVLLITGILSYLNAYSRIVATLHTVFGILFTLGVIFHLKNNFRSLKAYSKEKILLFISAPILLLFLAAYFQIEPMVILMDYGTRLKANSEQEINHSTFEVIHMNTDKKIDISVDLLRGEHYWHPQMAIWLEDNNGQYIETLFVTKATAKGLFFGGRSKENFKDFNEEDAVGDLRLVNALPIWSHKRGIKYPNGMYVPSHTDNFPDAITGETIKDNFKLNTSSNISSEFSLRLELNVAFDDNEFYSEFDFPDDEVFHSGTGQLGQPSIVYEANIDLNDHKNYYLMNLIGHGHQSGQTGEIFRELNTLTTAKQLVERIVVGIHPKIIDQ